MAGEVGPASHPLRVPYAVSIEPVHRSPLPSAVRERWAQSCKENSAAASPKGTCEAALSELADADARQVLQRSPVASLLWPCTPYGLAGGLPVLREPELFREVRKLCICSFLLVHWDRAIGCRRCCTPARPVRTRPGSLTKRPKRGHGGCR